LVVSKSPTIAAIAFVGCFAFMTASLVIPTNAQADIYFDVEEVTEQIALDVIVCQWYELETQPGENSWIIRAMEDIADLHFGAWDHTDYLRCGDIEPYFTEQDWYCSYDELGGPPVPGDPVNTYWQILDLTGGNGLEESHYYKLTIDKPPRHGGERQNLWLHPTPEPSTLSLLALGGLTLMKRRRRK